MSRPNRRPGRMGHMSRAGSRPGRLLLAVVAVLVLVGCTTHDPAGPLPTAPGASSGDGVTIALLLPESKTSRYEGIDRPVFEQVVAQRCAECRVLYANAQQDAALQQQQAESALTQGAEVLVLGAVDAAAAQSIVTTAAERDVAVIAYDRFISDVPLDYFVAYDPVRVGQLQGEALVRAVGRLPAPAANAASSAAGQADAGQADAGQAGAAVASEEQAADGVLLVHGAATDPNVRGLKTGLSRALADSGLRVLAEYDNPDWSPDKAQEWVQGQLTQYAGQVVGVYAANDGMAGGAISALRAAGLDPPPPVTGQDAELAAIQRIVSGDQAMTVYKAISQQARTAAELSVRVLRGETPAATAQVQGVPSVLLTPVTVTREQVQSVIVRGGVYTVEEICVEPYASACAELGLLGEVGG